MESVSQSTLYREYFGHTIKWNGEVYLDTVWCGALKLLDLQPQTIQDVSKGEIISIFYRFNLNLKWLAVSKN